MQIPNKEITTSEEYVDFVEKFITLLDKQMTRAESEIGDQLGLMSVLSSMPALISLVNTVGYLRGQDGMFINIRPTTENQSTLYEYEDHFEARLKKLIEVVLESNLSAEYKKRLNMYFVQARTLDFS